MNPNQFLPNPVDSQMSNSSLDQGFFNEGFQNKYITTSKMSIIPEANENEEFVSRNSLNSFLDLNNLSQTGIHKKSDEKKQSLEPLPFQSPGFTLAGDEMLLGSDNFDLKKGTITQSKDTTSVLKPESLGSLALSQIYEMYDEPKEAQATQFNPSNQIFAQIPVSPILPEPQKRASKEMSNINIENDSITGRSTKNNSSEITPHERSKSYKPEPNAIPAQNQPNLSNQNISHPAKTPEDSGKSQKINMTQKRGKSADFTSQVPQKNQPKESEKKGPEMRNKNQGFIQNMQQNEDPFSSIETVIYPKHIKSAFCSKFWYFSENLLIFFAFYAYFIKNEKIKFF